MLAAEFRSSLASLKTGLNTGKFNNVDKTWKNPKAPNIAMKTIPALLIVNTDFRRNDFDKIKNPTNSPKIHIPK
jgi:hypothetical protein